MSIIKGSKGGGKPSPPYEAPDTLESHDFANVLHLMGAGPIEGPVSVFVDDVPLLNPDGSSNFPGYSIETRPGTQDQTYIEGFAAVESETMVQQEIKADTPITRTISNPAVNYVDVRIKVPSLVSMTEEGDRYGTRVDLTAEIAQNGGGFYHAGTITIDGKTKSPFIREARLTLPPGGAPWRIRITRNTPDATTDRLQNKTLFESYGEIIDAKYRYPNSALVGLKIDAQYSSGTSGVEFEGKWRIVKVPSNYDPATRIYNGVWDGTFKPAWTDNPAWVMYDLITDDADGLGEFLPAANVDKWELYKIGQYCDELVDDGFGGREPRYTANGEIGGRSEAYAVLKDIAGACGCVTYWDGSTVRFAQDRPSDNDMPLFTTANVIGGNFAYQGASQKSRHSVILVEYRDKEDGYKKKVEYVQDNDLVARWGIVQNQIAAFMCTSRGQAHRAGKSVLVTEATESEMIAFDTGMEAAFLYPGRVFKVADPVRSGVRHGGRVASSTIRTITLDKAPEQLLTGSRTITIIRPDGVPMVLNVAGISGNVVTVGADIPSAPIAGATWVMQGDNVAPTLWRCMGVEQKQDGTYGVTALAHNPHKYAQIENGLILAPPPPSLIPDVVPPAVTGLAVSQANRIDPTGKPVMDLDVSWTPISGKGVRGYAAQWKRDGDNWNYLPEQNVPFVTVEGVVAGEGEIRAWAVGRTGVSGKFASVRFGIANPSAKPPAVTSFTATGAMMAVNLAWRYVGDIGHLKTVELYMATEQTGTPVKLSDLAPGTTAFVHNGVALGQRYYYWLYVTDVYGNRSDAAMTNGECIKDPSALLDQLNGSIGFDALDQELRDPIVNAGNVDASLDNIIESVLQGVLSDDVQFVESQVQGENLATVQTLVKTELGPEGALAQRIDSVVAKFDDDIAAVQQTATAQAGEIEGVKAQYTLKVTAGGKVGGMGIYTDADGSVVDFLADKFFVSAPDGTGSKQVFSVGKINGVDSVGINGQLIVDGSISARHLSADSVTADKINVTSLDAVSATIGTLRTATSGARTEIRDNLILVYDVNNVLRVRMGVW